MQEAQTLNGDLRATLQEATIRNEEQRSVIDALRQERRGISPVAPLLRPERAQAAEELTAQ